jgi:hypothetical protein
MSQHFQDEAMAGPAGEPPDSADAAAEAASEGYEEGGAYADEADLGADADAGSDADLGAQGAPGAEAAADDLHSADSADGIQAETLVDAFAQALDAADGEEFFARLLGGLDGSSDAIPVLQRYRSEGLDEAQVFDALAQWFEEEQAELAVPLMAGFAARMVARPLLRQAGAALKPRLRRQMVRRAAEAARILARRRGPRAVRALPSLARSVARCAVRRLLPPRTVPRALQRTATELAARPQLVRQLMHPANPSAPAPRGNARRIRVAGPVEITISTL